MCGLDRYAGGTGVGGIAVLVAVGSSVAVGIGSGVSVGKGVAVGGISVGIGGTSSVGANKAVIVISGVGNTKGVGAENVGILQASARTARDAMIIIIGFRLSIITPPPSISDAYRISFSMQLSDHFGFGL